MLPKTVATSHTYVHTLETEECNLNSDVTLIDWKTATYWRVLVQGKGALSKCLLSGG